MTHREHDQPAFSVPAGRSVLLAPHGRVELAFVADNPGRWLMHCHAFERHAGGMGTSFEVVG